MDAPRHPANQTRPAQQWRVGGDVRAISRDVPDEAAIGLSYDGQPHVVLMATPTDVEDLALGFTLTERIATAGQVRLVVVQPREEGLSVDLLLEPAAGRSLAAARARTLEGRSSCGLCGVQHIKQAVRPLPPVGDGLSVTRAAIQAGLAALEREQTLGRLTRATHAAAWLDARGGLRLVREDVGRHNALDKLVGAAARAGLDPAQAFILVTSRCSYEMVEKAVMAGVSILVAISAPTALAIRKAEEAGLTLVALARADGHTVFTRGDRVCDAREEVPA
jgi:FdhD protein